MKHNTAIHMKRYFLYGAGIYYSVPKIMGERIIIESFSRNQVTLITENEVNEVLEFIQKKNITAQLYETENMSTRINRPKVPLLYENLLKRIGMFLLPLIMLISCQENKDGIRENFQAEVVRMGNSEVETGKQKIPETVKTVLFKVKDENLYFELNCQDNPDIITHEWWYNHSEGDEVHFDRLLKSRFFPIKEEKKQKQLEQKETVNTPTKSYYDSLINNQ